VTDYWAPERIWLQRGMGEEGSHTWCEDSIEKDSIGDGVEQAEYILADAQAPSVPLLDAAKAFYNATIADTSVIVRAPSAEKRDNIKRLGDELRALLQVNGATK